MKSVRSMKQLVAALYFNCIVVILIVIYINYLFPWRLSVLSGAKTSETTENYLFIIVMTSYPRKNGKSPYYIKKAVTSVLSQSYSNWELFVTGDKYENEEEFRSLFKAIPSSKLFLYNLPKPGERNNLTGIQLWESGGVIAMNNAIERAEKHHKNCGTRCKIYFTNHDDDDIWSTEHLRELLSIFIRFPSVVFAWNKGYYCGQGGNLYPPDIVPQDKVNNWHQAFGSFILHSSWSWDMNIFRGFRYRGQWDFPSNFRGSKVSDLDLFERIRIHIQEKKLNYYHSNRGTIEHLIEMGNSCAKNGALWYPD